MSLFLKMIERSVPKSCIKQLLFWEHFLLKIMGGGGEGST